MYMHAHYIHAHVHACSCMYMHAHVHTCSCTCMLMYVHACSCTYMLMYMHAHVCTCMLMYIHAHVHACSCTCMLMYVHACSCTYMHAHVHTNLFKHLHSTECSMHLLMWYEILIPFSSQFCLAFPPHASTYYCHSLLSLSCHARFSSQLVAKDAYEPLVYVQVILVNLCLNYTWTALLIALLMVFPTYAFRLSSVIASVAGFTSGFFIPIENINWA